MYYIITFYAGVFCGVAIMCLVDYSTRCDNCCRNLGEPE